MSKDALSMMKTVLVELEQINQQFTILTVLTAGVEIQQFALICNKWYSWKGRKIRLMFYKTD